MPAEVQKVLPLAGLRVIEVSTFVAGPLGGMALAQLGADVIRVDPPGGAADHSRWPLAPSGVSLYWAGLNKAKRSLVIDLQTEEGQAIVLGLIDGSGPNGGIVLTNAVGRPWLEYGALRQRRHDLIHAHITGHRDGRPAVDYTVNAAIGFPMVTGPEGHANPVNHVLPAWDIACGLYTALGILSADRQRRRTGAGQAINVALYDVALAMAGNLGFLAEAQVGRIARQRIGNYLYGGFARDFGTRDGSRIMIVALTQRHWKELLAVTDLEAVIGALESSARVDFNLEKDRFSYREVLAGLFARWFSQRDVDEVERLLDRTSLLWSRFGTFADVIAKAQSIHPETGLLAEIDQPGVGAHLAPGSPLRLSPSIGTTALRAPMLGEHTDEILSSELGLSARELRDLHDRGVVAGRDGSATRSRERTRQRA